MAMGVEGMIAAVIHIGGVVWSRGGHVRSVQFGVGAGKCEEERGGGGSSHGCSCAHGM